jgi:hypothetical protein
LVTPTVGTLVLGDATATNSPGLSSTTSVTFTANRAGTAKEMVLGTDGGLVVPGVVSATGNITSTANVSGGNLITSGLISATGSANALNLVTRNGDANPNNSKTQIALGYNGTTDYSQFVHTRHNAGNSSFNTIELWTSYGTQAGTFPSNAILGLTVSNSRVSIGNSIVNPGNTLDVGGNLYSTGNITGGNIITAGLISATGNITGGNILGGANVNATTHTGTTVNVTGNITGGNLTTGGLVSATGNITGGNLTTGGLVSATGNITGGNITTTGLISATGNITGGNILGGANVNATTHTGTTVNVTGNVTGGNLTTGGLVSATGNITATGNISGGNLTITGNTATITSANYQIGYLNIPQISLAANSTTALTDAGKHFYSVSASNLQLTIANNTSVSWPVGTAMTIVNRGTANVLVVPDTGVSLYLAGNSTSANRVVTTYGMATVINVASNIWMINGTVT